jgi:hypothetical protein
VHGEHVAPSLVAGWSSLVARQAHNLKVAGSNPAPAPNLKPPESSGGFFFSGGYKSGGREIEQTREMRRTATTGNFGLKNTKENTKGFFENPRCPRSSFLDK